MLIALNICTPLSVVLKAVYSTYRQYLAGKDVAIAKLQRLRSISQQREGGVSLMASIKEVWRVYLWDGSGADVVYERAGKEVELVGGVSQESEGTSEGDAEDCLLAPSLLQPLEGSALFGGEFGRLSSRVSA